MRFMTFVRWLFSRSKIDYDKIRIEADDDYLYWWNADKLMKKMSWQQVKEIFAFKRDVVAVDMICIGFRVDEEGAYNEIDEEMEGYEQVLDFISQKFGVKLEDWFSKVAFPAFATNCTCLWGKAKICDMWAKEM